jgi:hypothetical protein
MEKYREKVDFYMNLKGTLCDTSKGQYPSNPIEILMAQFVSNFEDTLKIACTDRELGLFDINPRTLIAMGLTNIIINMILNFKNITTTEGSAKETLSMFDELMNEVRLMVQNSLGMLEASRALEQHPH